MSENTIATPIPSPADLKRETRKIVARLRALPRNIKQTQVASETGLGNEVVSRFFRGLCKEPSIATIHSIQAWLAAYDAKSQEDSAATPARCETCEGKK